MLVNICRRSGVGGKDITEEKKVSYLSALVTLLQVSTDPQKVCTSGLTVTLNRRPRKQVSSQTWVSELRRFYSASEFP